MKYTLPTLVLLTFVSFEANADQTYNMDQITNSLQNEYQAQLNRKPKRSTRKKRKSKRAAVPANWAALLDDKKKQPARSHPNPQRHAPQAIPPKQHIAKPQTPAIPHIDQLFDAASNGSVQSITRLLQQGLNVNATTPERETALHMAAAKGQYAAAIYLINHGANIHARTVNNWLPIHHAARFRHANIANYLLRRGSSPHARTSDGLSAIDMARAVKDQRLLGLFGAR